MVAFLVVIPTWIPSKVPEVLAGVWNIGVPVDTKAYPGSSAMLLIAPV